MENSKENARKNNYKTVRDLVDYMNSTGLFNNSKVEEDDIYQVFEKAHLFYFNYNTNRYEPTSYMMNSNGCFLTKSGKILFTEPLFKYMTEDNPQYKAYDWLEWFVNTYNSDDKLPIPQPYWYSVDQKEEKPIITTKLKKYVVITKINGIRIYKAESTKDAKAKAVKKYKDIISVKLFKE